MPVLQGVRAGLPDRDRHGDVQVGGLGQDLSRAATAALALRAGLVAALGPADHPDPGARAAGQRTDRDSGTPESRPMERRCRPAAQPAAVRRPLGPVPARGAYGAGRAAADGARDRSSRRRAGRGVGRLVLGLFHRRRGGGRAGRAGVGRLRTAVAGTVGLLRTDLDHDRSARRRPAPAPQRPRRAAPDRGCRDSDRRPGAVVHGGLAQRRRRAAAGRCAGAGGERRRGDARRAARPDTGAGSRRT